MRTAAYTISESLRLVRDGRKIGRLASLGALQLVDYKAGKGLRHTYLFLRHLDDAADGDLQVNDASQYVKELEKAVFGTHEPIPNVASLGKAGLKFLQERSSADDDPKKDLKSLIDSIYFDVARSQTRRAISGSELNHYYQGSVGAWLNLMLIGVNSDIRNINIPEFAPSMAILHSIRDLETDWQRGVINIPAETLDSFNATASDSIGSIRANAGIASWIATQTMEATNTLNGLRSNFKDYDFNTRFILGNLASHAIRDVGSINQ